ncbi:FmdB family zinc ribbon protein [Glaciibacter superstes]|uniref:FmdB family zinc ribbon protein n=1 Tax=Glaciibacter superstes TaxID=501023 RepID=UPI00040683A8|nr:FmdB family zinc ribbon protein [Glaciibacter superstes]
MPTYSYRCTECNTAFDIQQAFTDDTLTECPSCGGKLRKVFSAVGVSFTGSGFYRNDSRPAPQSSEKSSEKSSGAPAVKEAASSASVKKTGTEKSAATPAAP